MSWPNGPPVCACLVSGKAVHLESAWGDRCCGRAGRAARGRRAGRQWAAPQRGQGRAGRQKAPRLGWGGSKEATRHGRSGETSGDHFYPHGTGVIVVWREISQSCDKGQMPHTVSRETTGRAVCVSCVCVQPRRDGGEVLGLAARAWWEGGGCSAGWVGAGRRMVHRLLRWGKHKVREGEQEPATGDRTGLRSLHKWSKCVGAASARSTRGPAPRGPAVLIPGPGAARCRSPRAVPPPWPPVQGMSLLQAVLPQQALCLCLHRCRCLCLCLCSLQVPAHQPVAAHA